MPVLGTVRGVWEARHAACDAWDEGHYGEVVWHAGNAALQVTSFKGEAKLGVAKGKGVKITHRNKAFPKPVKNAYKLAKEGKIHGELYPKNVNKPANQLIRSVRSMKKQIDKHRGKIANPKRYWSAWDTFSKEHQERQILKWTREINKFIEECDIFQGILDNR